MSVKEAAEEIGKQLTAMLLEEYALQHPEDESLEREIEKVEDVIVGCFVWARSQRPDFWFEFNRAWEKNMEKEV